MESNNAAPNQSSRPRHRFLVSVACLVLSSSLSPTYAQAQVTGICQVDCFSALANCMASTPGCRVTEDRDCPDGTQCHNGRCGNGATCPKAISAECAPCIAARSICLAGCPETWLPELIDATIKAKLNPATERVLLRELLAAERAATQGVQQAAQHIKTYQTLLRVESRDKAISDPVVSKLDEVAQRTAATLQSKQVPACVASLTDVGEVVIKSKESKQK